MKPIKILFISGWLWPWAKGGPSVVLLNLVKKLALNPHFDLTVCGVIPWAERGKLYSYYPKNVKFIIMPTFWGADGLFDTLSSQVVYALKILLTRDQYNIVHFNIFPGLRCATIPLFMRFFKQIKSAFILNFHDIPVLEAYTRSESKLKALGTLIHWAISKSFIKYFDVIIVNSNFMRSAANGVIIPKKIVVIPNGINMSSDKCVHNYVTLKGKLNILCVGGFFPKKGQDKLIMGFNLAKSKSLGHIYFVGKKTRFLDQCRRLSVNLGLSDKISFVESLSPNDLTQLLNSVDIYAQPSLWEGFGISILEAMSFGKPVIVSKVGGQTDFVINCLNGFLVSPEKPDELSRIIDLLAFDSELREKLGKAAQSTAENYDWRLVITKYEQLYNCLVDSGNN